MADAEGGTPPAGGGDEVEQLEEIPAEQWETEGGQGAAGGTEVGGYKIDIAEKQLPLVGIMLSSVILIIAMTTPMGRSKAQYYGYGVSVGAIALAFSFAGLVMTLNTFRDSQSAGQFSKFNNYFLVVWNFLGALILTFWGPFLNTSNGYFAAWALAIFAVMGIGVTKEHVSQKMSGMGSQMGFGACGIIILIAIIPFIRDGDGQIRSVAIYGIVLACLTIPLAFGSTVLLPSPGMVKFIIFTLFSFMWIIFACLATFRGPFTETGNGYFGSWGGAVTSVFAAIAAKSTPVTE